MDLRLQGKRALVTGSSIRIVNVSSVAGVMPQPTGPDDSASKAAINNLSLSLTKSARCIGSDGKYGFPWHDPYAETRRSIPSDGNY